MPISNIIISKSLAELEQTLAILKTTKLQTVATLRVESKTIFDMIKADDLLAILAKCKGRYVYLIKYRGDHKTFQKIQNAYKTFDSSNKPHQKGVSYSISRYNSEHESQYLYVGTSKMVTSRIKQHLGWSKSKGTYAMHLAQWFPKNIDVELEIIQLKSIDIDLVHECIEQTYWNTCQPLFGKRSGL